MVRDIDDWKLFEVKSTMKMLGYDTDYKSIGAAQNTAREWVNQTGYAYAVPSIRKLRDEGTFFPVNISLDKANFLKQPVNHKENNFAYKCFRYDVSAVPRVDYWETLDNETKPEEYLKLLGLWRGSINLSSLVAGEGLIPSTGAVSGFWHNTYWMPLPLVQEDRLTYAVYIKRFREVILYRSLIDSFGILDISRTEDLDSVSNAYSYLLNRLLPSVKNRVNILNNVSFVGVDWDQAISTIPFQLSPEPGVDIYDNTKKELEINFWPPSAASINRSTITYFSDRTTNKNIAVGGGRCSVPYTDINGNIIAIRSAREALIHEIESALIIVKIQEAKLGSRVAELSDIEASILPTAFTLDPYQNPFLAFDPEASARAGVPTFKNIAASIAPTKTPEYVEAKWGPGIEQYAKVPGLRDIYTRNYVTDTGARVSEKDLQDMGALQEGGGSIVPWIIGGLTAAAIASQVM